MKAEDFIVLELCRKLRRVKNPPYTCPIEECKKVYQGLCGLQYHLNHANHSIAKLKVFFSELPDIPPATPHKSHSRRKGRFARLPEPPPIVVQNEETADEGSAQASRSMVQFQLNNKQVHVKNKNSIEIRVKEDYEEEFGEKSANTHITNNLTKCWEAVTKLPTADYRDIQSYDIPDASSLPISYIRFIERSAEELDGEVEYDMDEEDTAWLESANEKRAKNDLPPVSMESFELLMDRLEKESYFLVQMNKEVDSSLAVIDDEAVCSICLDGECQNSNVILFCDMCNLAVHQDCYGVPYIPEGHWLCRRCLHSPSAPVDCVLCPNNGGAFKQTDRAHWAHVVCALWIPEVRFANTVFLEPIDSIESIPAARWRLTCYICKQRGVGACIQCHKTNCYSAFHVTCAQQAGLYMKMETVRDNSLGAVLVQKIAYCDTHAPIDAESKARMQAANKKKDLSVSSNDKMKTARRVLAKKRSVAPVISIPTIPPERIQEIASLITTPKKSYFIQRLIAYWTLKRQFRNGVPLLRRLQTSHLARRDESKQSIEQVTDISELYRQMKYWQSLRQDLERARLLCELVRKREKHKKEYVKVKEEYVLTALNPFHAFLLNVISQLKAKDTGEIFIEPVDQNEVPDYGDIITHPMDLQTMTEKIKDFQYSTLDALEADFNLMISNCLAYNSKETIFYKAGIRMKEQGGAIIRQAKKDFAANRFDMTTGLLIDQVPFKETRDEKSKTECTPVEQVQVAEIDRELAAIADPNNRMGDNDIMCKLLQLLDKSELLKHKGARMKRLKLVKVQMATIRRKQTRQIRAQLRANEKEDKSEVNERVRNSTPENSKNIAKTSQRQNAINADNSPEKSKRKRKDVSFNNTDTRDKNKRQVTPAPNTPTVVFKKPNNPLSSESEKKSVVIKRRRNKRLSNTTPGSKPVIPNSESFRIYRSSNEMPDETDEDTQSSSSSCSCSDEESENSSSDSEENSTETGNNVDEEDASDEEEDDDDDEEEDDDDEDEDDDDDDEEEDEDEEDDENDEEDGELGNEFTY